MALGNFPSIMTTKSCGYWSQLLSTIQAVEIIFKLIIARALGTRTLQSETVQLGKMAIGEVLWIALYGHILSLFFPKMSQKRVVIVPGNGDGDVEQSNWYGWLQNKLAEVKQDTLSERLTSSLWWQE